MTLLMTEHYPRQQSIGTALAQFVKLLSDSFSENVSMCGRQTIVFNEYFCTEIIHFSSGSQIRATLERDAENFEIRANAYKKFNYGYLEMFSDSDFDFLCMFIRQKYAELSSTTADLLSNSQAAEREQLLTIGSKLSILTGNRNSF